MLLKSIKKDLELKCVQSLKSRQLLLKEPENLEVRTFDLVMILFIFVQRGRESNPVQLVFSLKENGKRERQHLKNSKGSDTRMNDLTSKCSCEI